MPTPRNEKTRQVTFWVDVETADELAAAARAAGVTQTKIMKNALREYLKREDDAGVAETIEDAMRLLDRARTQALLNEEGAAQPGRAAAPVWAQAATPANVDDRPRF